MPCPSFGTLEVPPQMIFPASGATGVADGNFTIVLGRSGGTLTLNGPNGVSVTTSPTSVPSPLPSGAATPTPGSSPAAYAVGALSPATTYAIQANYASPQAGCPTIPQTVGSFTTQ